MHLGQDMLAKNHITYLAFSFSDLSLMFHKKLEQLKPATSYVLVKHTDL